ncbi:Mus7/MMS22 family-domain-containing protein [Coniochaeta sp. 2T2.1]|nr:Mus7/MMS22 family-domain-containing protein [Coniochaeta sp. 2T2.1]
MRNWKELGEVPDSDDESFDSPDSQQDEIHPQQLVDNRHDDLQTEKKPPAEGPEAHGVPRAIWDLPISPEQQRRTIISSEGSKEKLASVQPPALKAVAKDIWDLPLSPEDAVENTVLNQLERSTPPPIESEGLSSSPLSSPPLHDEDGDDDIDEIGILPSASAAAGVRNSTAKRKGAVSMARPPATFEEDEISTPYVTITAPLPGRSTSTQGQSNRVSLPTTSASRKTTTSYLEIPLGTTSQRNLDLVSHEAPSRGRRALRPRKPIQQHPYLLESVQYAHVMKSHGVKPVRVLTAEASQVKKPEGGDSQDREFEDESSQEPSHDPNLDDESQPIMFDDMDDGQDIFAFSPSPPKTSPRNILQTSSQRSEGNRTDNTSVLEDDFPSIEELVRRPPKPKPRTLKRQLSSKLLPHSKRLNRLPTSSAEPSSPPVGRHRDVWTLPPSSPVVGGFSGPSQDLGNTPRFLHTHNAGAPAPAAVPRNSPSSIRRQTVVDLTAQNEEDDSSGSETSSSASSSKSGSEVIRRNGKRIRGVLPASWLRIDQQKNQGEKQKKQRTREPTPEPAAPRRGIAVRKATSPRPPTPTSALMHLFSDESGDDEITTVKPGPARRQTSPDEEPLVIWSDHDDAGSVVEEDLIDRMFVGSKRNRSLAEPASTAKRLKTTHKNPSEGQPNAKTRQPRITDVLGRTKSSARAKTSAEAKQRRHRPHKPSRLKAPVRRAGTPPRLSVLDVMEAGVHAPPFLKIAARTAERRQDRGKSSPTYKHINLGTRKDNVDALSVLRDWKSGRILPKPSKQQRKTTGRQPLQNLPTNTSPTLMRDHRNVQRAESAGLDMDLISLDNDHDSVPQTSPSGPRKAVPATRTHSWSARPAQLETEEDDRQDRVGFHARKRALDAVFRRARKSSSTSSVLLEQQWDSIRAAHREDEQESGHPAKQPSETHETPRRNYVKSRFRKRVLPKPVDLQAPHFVHADDPLPPEDVLVAEEPDERQPQDKLYGLAPYGTKYTHHFEVFPLDRGVYFHSTSLVGSGWINKINDSLYPERTRGTRPRALFSIDGKHLRWGPWDETVSSELGILVDWIAERLLSPLTAEAEAAVNAKPQEAAAFLLKYAVDSISFPNEDSDKSFVSRSMEVADGLLNRIDEARPSTSATAHHNDDDLAQVLTCLTLFMHAVHRISGPDMVLKFQVEALLARTAKLCVRSLLAGGLDDLRTLYGDLQRLSARERGIRSNSISANSWVVLMRVLEAVRIPRSSFWDITQAAMTGPNIAPCSDARVFENLWRDMFTLLPLSEVNDYGVVKAGTRYSAPVEGWNLPQKLLLKRVFQLYMENPRQPPSFNEYCRALAARCHYLVHEWGWRKCAGIIGTWFDFFGSQNLSHLRNEEVYKSPRFLEELSGHPSLSIEPEDRCFHIFLKTLALVIQRLKKLGLTNDIRNLVARTLPNHNRQYLKEDTVHQRDLAALRNHHDLLCTLFWAAPPDLRPSLQLTEKLVVPGSSHKEACLINLRAWSQLARYVVSSGEGSAAFKPFVSWQNNIFQQVLEQYLSAASDIQQQVLALPKDGPRIGEDVVASMVKQNRAVAMDMLFVSLKASFEVLKLAGSLSVATYALNIYQLQQVFTRFDLASPDFDWTIVNLAVDMLEHYVSRIEKAAEEQYSSDSTGMSDSQDLEEATLLLDHNLAEKLFSLGRTLLELPAAERGFPSELVRCIEKTVNLSARAACRFIHSGLTRTANYFASGKYGLFRDSPLKLRSPQRKFLPLFVAVLIKNHVYDFKDVGATLFQLWMVSIVKPYRSLAYENQLAEILKQRSLPYLQGVPVLTGVAPDYRSNFDFFSCGMSHMRKALRESDSTQRRQLRDEYAKTLQSAMQRMKEDLSVLRPDRVEHRPYMDFVRRVIAMIKSHGVGICVIDPFFTQPSADYSPPMEDPRLHTAGIIAYGVRLGEGDSMAVSQLFYYLFNNFKIALINDKLDDEIKILENAMGNDHIFSFVLTRALPAMIWATSKIYEAWPLLDVYLGAVGRLLTRSVLSKEIDEDNLVHISALLSSILTWLRTLRCTNEPGLTKIQLHIMAQLLDLASVFQPSMLAHLCSKHEGDTTELEQSYASMTRFAEEALEYLDEAFELPTRRKDRQAAAVAALLGDVTIQPPLSRIRIASLCRGIPDFDNGPVFQSGRELDPQVDSFANEIFRDVRQNWVVTATSISLNTPARGSSMSSTQSGPGTRYELLEVDALLGKLRDRLRCWIPVGGVQGTAGNRRRKARMRFDEEFLF